MFNTKRKGTSRFRRLWVGGLLALAALLAGAGLKAQAADEPGRARDGQRGQPDLQRQIDDLRRQIEQIQRNMGHASPGFPAPPNFPGMPNLPFSDMFGRTAHGRMGIMVAPVGEVLADQLDLKKGEGLVVQEVRPGSSAAKAGVKPHDVLVEMDGKPVPDDYRAFAQMVSQVKADTPVSLVVIRKGKRETIKGLTLPEAREPQRVTPPAPGFGTP